jgi:hypothetical protein
MVSSGILRHVALVRTDVSEELSASFIMVTRIGKEVSSQRASVASYSQCCSQSSILVTPMKEALSSSETSDLTRAIPEDAIIYIDSY